MATMFFQERADYSCTSGEKDKQALEKMKQLEKKFAKRMKKVDILGGVAYTTDEKNYEDVKRNPRP